MLESPALDEEKICACLRAAYGLAVRELRFLPLGADCDTAVYRALGADGNEYFLKLRGGAFNPAGVAVPGYLHDHGLRHIIPPLPGLDGRLWADLPPYRLILYPYIKGQNAHERPLSAAQWVAFGAALRRFHDTTFPAALTAGIPREDFSPRWRNLVRATLRRIQRQAYSDPVAAETAAFLNSKRAETLALAARAGRLARALAAQALPFILCHADMHGWNLLLTAGEEFYIVDWDTLLLAPRERDLMFIGSGLMGGGRSEQEETTLFYQGYGQASPLREALAYYRAERIVEDIAVFCQQIFAGQAGEQDRRQALEYLKSNYLPGGTIEIAQQA